MISLFLWIRRESRLDLRELKTEFKKDISEVRTELKKDISEVNTELKSINVRLSHVEGEVKVIKEVLLPRNYSRQRELTETRIE